MMSERIDALDLGGDVTARPDPRFNIAGAAKLWLARIACLVLVLGVWEIAAARWIDPFWVSSPAAIFVRLVEWIADGTIAFHLSITMQEMAAGFAIGTVAGVTAGFILGRNIFLAQTLDVFIVAVYCLPKVALAPLFILWLGIGLAPKIALAAVIVFFLVFYSTFAGTRDVDARMIDTVRLMGANHRQILFKVIIPSTVVWIFTGLKLAFPYAIMGAVVGEMMASNRGIGALIEKSAGQFDTTGIFTALLVLMIVASIMNSVLVAGERRLTRWKAIGA